MSYGTVQAEKMTTESGYSLGAGNASSFKNRIINGNMVVSQRLGTSSLLCSNVTDYTLDRWLVVSNPQSKLTAQQDAGGVTPPAGFSDYLGITVTTAETITSGDFFNLVQFIEGYNIADLAWGTASAKPVTVSFWVRSSVTGAYSFAFRNNGETRSYVTTYTINAANTWEQKTITIQGDTSGTWNVTNGRGIEVNFDFGRASETSTADAWTASGNVRLAGTVKLVENASATWYLTGVQIEVGTVATSFDFRSISTELGLCYRYCFAWRTDASGYTQYGRFPMSFSSSATSANTDLFLPAPMRTTAYSVTYNNKQYQEYFTTGGGATGSTIVLNTDANGLNWVNILFTFTGSSLTTNSFSGIRFDNATDAALIVSTEL